MTPTDRAVFYVFLVLGFFCWLLALALERCGFDMDEEGAC